MQKAGNLSRTAADVSDRAQPPDLPGEAVQQGAVERLVRQLVEELGCVQVGNLIVACLEVGRCALHAGLALVLVVACIVHSMPSRRR